MMNKALSNNIAMGVIGPDLVPLGGLVFLGQVLQQAGEISSFEIGGVGGGAVFVNMALFFQYRSHLSDLKLDPHVRNSEYFFFTAIPLVLFVVAWIMLLWGGWEALEELPMPGGRPLAAAFAVFNWAVFIVTWLWVTRAPRVA